MKSKFTTRFGLVLIFILATYSQVINSASAQNPNWTLPGWYFQPEGSYLPLPQSPPDPVTGIPETDPTLAYQGTGSTHVHGGYTDPWGNLQFFTIDDKIYDAKGWLVGHLQRNETLNEVMGLRYKKGYNERLILPMGGSCSKYAIIYPAARDHQINNGAEDYTQNTSRFRIYMGVYEATANNTQNPNAQGALVGSSGGSQFNTLQDIAARDGLLYSGVAAPSLYGYTSVSNDENMQSPSRQNFLVAATEFESALFAGGGGVNPENECFYRVYIYDGRVLMRYKLTADDLEWDGVVEEFTDASATAQVPLRSEMEIIKLSNGNYRMAIPTAFVASINAYGFFVIDLDANGELIPGSKQTVVLPGTVTDGAQPHGVEFDQSGRYVYFTHSHHPQLPSALDVWDTDTESFVSLPSLAGIEDFRISFLERSGEEIYMVKDNAIGQLASPGNPTSPGWNNNVTAINPNYISTLFPNGQAQRDRRLLPEQIDDSDYAQIANRSCTCCEELAGVTSGPYSTPEPLYNQGSNLQVWSPGDNPFGNVADVYITDELRIREDAYIEIQDMNFYFAPGAKVVVERMEDWSDGGILHLKNTKFTSDLRCFDRPYENINCGDDEVIPTSTQEGEGGELPFNCAAYFWEGVIVEGNANGPQPGNHLQSSIQGRFLMDQGSVIEYAKTAIRVGHPNQAGYGGGVVRLRNSEIKDCVDGVRFDPYVRLNASNQEIFNVAVIRNMHFHTTADFLNVFGANIPGHFIHVEESSGIASRGNVFENEIPGSFNENNRGVGIYAANSRLREKYICTGSPSIDCSGGVLVPSLYRNLTAGINAIYSGSNRKMVAHYAEFEENRSGVVLQGAINPEVLDCKFEVLETWSGVGVYSIASTGYKIENNNFSHASPSPSYPWSLGVAVVSSGPSNNEVYNNTFTNIRAGITTQGQNADPANTWGNGLQLLCNTFRRPVPSADIYLDSGSIAKLQGNCITNDPSSPAGNSFSHTSLIPQYATSHFDYRMDEPDMSQFVWRIRYIHHDPPSPASSVLPIIISSTGPVSGLEDLELDNCIGNTYDKARSCPIKNTAFDQITVPTIGLAEWSPNEIGSALSLAEEEVSNFAATFDNGQTEAIMSLYHSGEDLDGIADMLEGVGDQLSPLLREVFAASENEALMAIADEANTLASDAVDTDEESSASSDLMANFYQWIHALRERDALWVSIVDLLQTDTTGVFTMDALGAYFDEYEPQQAARYYAAHCLEHQLAIPEWVGSKNDPTHIVEGLNPLPSLIGDSLPHFLPEHFDAHYFDHWGNVQMLNELYITHASSYSNQWNEPASSGIGHAQEEVEEIQTFHQPDAGLVNVFPNPFNSEINFEFVDICNHCQTVELMVFDLLGKRLAHAYLGKDTPRYTLPGAQLPAGMLLYTVIVDGELIQSGKILHLD